MLSTHRSVAPLLVAFLVVLGCDPAPDTESRAIEGVGEPAWVQEAVVYEVFVPDASEEGTFQGLIGRLDEIESMGVTTLWLMPIHPIGEERRKSDIGALGSPYSIRDYRAVNPDYGTEEDFQALVDSVHARDMHLILDLVPNHTAWDHPWLEEHPDRYTDGPIDGFTVPVLDGDTTDWTDVVELNYDNPETRQAMIDIMQYWVREFDVDGYRADVAHAVPLDFWEAAIDSVEAVKPVLMLAEAAEPEMHEVGFDWTYGWPFYGQLKRIWAEDEPVRALVTHADSTLDRLPGAGARLQFTTNHDETMWDAPPPALFDGQEGAQAAFVLATSMHGVPLVYSGQELGVEDTVSFFARTPYEWADADGPVTEFYRDYLALYRDSPALRNGELEVLTPDAEDALLYRRSTGEDEVLVAVNVRSTEQSIELPARFEAGELETVLGGTSPEGTTLNLEPYGIRILQGGV